MPKQRTLADIDAIVSTIGFWFGELKDIRHPRVQNVRAMMGRVIEEFGPQREPQPYSIPGGMVVAESFSHGQAIIEREERAAEKAQ